MATATASMKPATTETGLVVVHVPQFVTEGEVVRVDTEGKYIERQQRGEQPVSGPQPLLGSLKFFGRIEILKGQQFWIVRFEFAGRYRADPHVREETDDARCAGAR